MRSGNASVTRSRSRFEAPDYTGGGGVVTTTLPDGSTGAIRRWLYRDPAVPALAMMDQGGYRRTGREIALTTPLDEATVVASATSRPRR